MIDRNRYKDENEKQTEENPDHKWEIDRCFYGWTEINWLIDVDRCIVRVQGFQYIGGREYEKRNERER